MKNCRLVRWVITSMMTASALLLCTVVQAGLIAVPPASFGPPNVTFSEVALGTPLNGLTINGFTFAETISNTTLFNGGPGNTNDITQPSALGSGNPTGEIITVTMPGLMSEFGFGYADLEIGTDPNAVTITLFDGAANLGSLSYTGAPDPTFTGGFAGIESSTPFTSAEIVFSSLASAYDFDNISANSATPEPGSATTALLGALVLIGGMQWRQMRPASRKRRSLPQAVNAG